MDRRYDETLIYVSTYVVVKFLNGDDFNTYMDN